MCQIYILKPNITYNVHASRSINSLTLTNFKSLWMKKEMGILDFPFENWSSWGSLFSFLSFLWVLVGFYVQFFFEEKDEVVRQKITTLRRKGIPQGWSFSGSSCSLMAACGTKHHRPPSIPPLMSRVPISSTCPFFFIKKKEIGPFLD